MTDTTNSTETLPAPSPSAPVEGGRVSTPPGKMQILTMSPEALKAQLEGAYKEGFQAGQASAIPPQNVRGRGALTPSAASLAAAVPDYAYIFDGDLIAASEARGVEGAPFKGEVFRPTRLELNPGDHHYRPETVAIFVGPSGGRVVGKPHEFFPDAPAKDLTALGTIRKGEKYQIMMMHYQGRLQGCIFGEAVGVEGDHQSPAQQPTSELVGLDVGSDAVVQGGALLEIVSDELPTKFELHRARSEYPCLVDAILAEDGSEVALELSTRGTGEDRGKVMRVTNMPRKPFSSGTRIRVRLKNAGDLPIALACVLEGRAFT